MHRFASLMSVFALASASLLGIGKTRLYQLRSAWLLDPKAFQPGPSSIRSPETNGPAAKPMLPAADVMPVIAALREEGLRLEGPFPADAFFARRGNLTVFIGRLLPIVRTFISFPAGVARMPLGPFVLYSTAGAFLWSTLLVWAGTVVGAHWVDIRHALQPFDLLIAVIAVGLVVLFVWWRLGRPGWRRGAA